MVTMNQRHVVMYHPNHPHLSKRKPCEATLMKKVKTKSGYCLKPQKVYPYLPLQSHFKDYLKDQILFQNERNGVLVQL